MIAAELANTQLACLEQRQSAKYSKRHDTCCTCTPHKGFVCMAWRVVTGISYHVQVNIHDSASNHCTCYTNCCQHLSFTHMLQNDYIRIGERAAGKYFTSYMQPAFVSPSAPG